MNKDYSNEIGETVNTFLNSLSDDELRKIINDSNQDCRLDELVEKCPIVPKLTKEKDNLIAENKALADQNFQKEPTYNELRKVLEDAHKQAVELKQKIIEKQTKLNKLKPKMTPDTLRGLLQVAAQESEEQSEEITKQFLSDEKTYEEFIKEFIKKRTEYHIRRLKYEKLIESIQNPNLRLDNSSSNPLVQQNKPPTSLNQANSSNNLFHHQLSNYPPSNLNNPLPYPTTSSPFAYQPFHTGNQPFSTGNQPFNTGIQPIRAAPLPPTSMMDLPPYSAPSASFPPSANSYRPSNQPAALYPFNINPNYR